MSQAQHTAEERMGNHHSKNTPNEEPLTCMIVGAGSRGTAYSRYSVLFPEQLKVVGLAEPHEGRRNKLLKLGTVPPENVFTDWHDAAKREKFADFVVITTVDQDHKDPAIAFARLGYHILLEKPMAVTEADCREIVSVCNSCGVKLAVCHVLRYTPWVCKIKEIIDSGDIGEIVSIRHTEPIGYWHFAHSFVRGNWRNEATSTFSLMAKSCHDIDLINHWMSPHRCQRVSSFGKLSHFTKEDKPPGAASRCVDCPIESSCPYSAKRLYLDFVKQGHTGWPLSVLTSEVDIENVTDALRTGPYGRCVYESDNDVVSHQVVNFQYDNGATVAFNMVAFTKRLCQREVCVYGTKGQISFEDGWDSVQVFDFLTEHIKQYSIRSEHPAKMGGHGGADYHMMKCFMDSLNDIDGKVATGPEETLNSHLLVFAAEKARLENRVVEIQPDGTF
ncbi:putative oxidoreductase YteT [Aplysia californica]|uniref:Oxidoreductase YteT n=1 Tax=Aplysia californica TaxID=6500 RepID=A0ABM0JRN2_APLCA|nr:putative oxidoreductase YteT [Aplysia californica]